MFKRPCFYKKGKVIILGVEILNIQAGHFYFIKDEYIKQNKEVTVNDDLKRELNTKANRVLELVKAGNKNLVFPDIINIEKYLLKNKI